MNSMELFEFSFFSFQAQRQHSIVYPNYDSRDPFQRLINYVFQVYWNHNFSTTDDPPRTPDYPPLFSGYLSNSLLLGVLIGSVLEYCSIWRTQAID
ncbi:hypothetical protein Csa_005425 [Cucumis sativus]|uniref:Uncharacterized protein n=1 Tax=Cucumis sativus TaxID=3659 RepID=A0A0A0KEE0_CUCSA|nr:hypothetical protein Csa_005425 [Cucumis sativus]